ncbi:MAG: cobalamin B12-binding domain-containing protein [Candidatus Omnitrophica bacterium]|nr:cobalamin B12-binding domain-containing protein [Candidatus Omnitrophota bacterium]
MNKKLLLTSVCRPIGPEFGDATSVGYELLHSQVTRAQGIFSPRCVIHHFSLEYIAHNLDTPTVVLQYPSEKEFIRELQEEYDFIGISFVLSTFHRMRRMVALIRKHSPHSKIILGGYGTVMSDEELAPYGDYVCREEGVAFLRKVLDETPKPMPYDHPLIINGLKIFSIPVGNNGMVFGGLGCPNGCDFCCTSHFFKRKHIRLLPEGDHIFDLIQRYRKKDSQMKFTVLDEDFLLNQTRSRRFLELVRNSGGAPPSMFVFSSIRALSQYTIQELLEMGINGVWIGYEGKRSGYAKQKGRDVGELFKEFREHGINILASMIIGFDYQTPEIIREELNELIRLRPTFIQTLIYGPMLGTPFYERMKAEDRLLPEYRDDREHFYRRCTGFYGVAKHPTLSSSDLESLQEECFKTDFKALGPSIVRAVESWFLGYQKLVHDKSGLLRKRAEIYKQDILNALPIFLSAKLLGPSREAREYAARLYKDISGRLGSSSVGCTVKSWTAFAMAGYTSLCLKMKWFQHPRLTRIAYRF